MTRLIDFSDGYETAAAPDQGVILTGGFGGYASDAAFLVALAAQGGVLGAGNAYYNTTLNRLRSYNGTAWVSFSIAIDPPFFVQSFADDATFGAALTAAGGTLAEGALYWNSTDDQLRVYDGAVYWRIHRMVDGAFKLRSYASDAAFVTDIGLKGGTLTPGSAYWNSTSNTLKVYNGTVWNEVLFTSVAQTITNKDIDGGVATATNRIGCPTGTTAALTALPRKAGLIYFATDSLSFLVDDGSNLNAVVGAPVSSVNGFVGVVVIGTDDVAEGVTNLYFTDLRAQTAVITQVITNGVTDKAPSEDAVFDALALKQDTSEKGAANGYASLDGSGTVPIAQLPSTVVGAVDYQGTWDANTNSPDLPASTPAKGDYYVVSVAGATSLGGITDWGLGDWAIYNGSAWEKVDNSEAVTSVNSQTGAVVLVTDDIAEDGSPVNLWFTDARAQAAVVTQVITDGVTTTSPSEDAVFDALALKQSLSEKDAANGYAGLDASSLIANSQLQNVIEDDINDAETTKAPTQNAVYDALYKSPTMVAANIVSVAGSHSVGVDDKVLLVDTTAARAITLPTPALRSFWVKDVSGQAQTNPISLLQNAAENIEGLAATRELSANFGSWLVVGDGTNWHIL